MPVLRSYVAPMAQVRLPSTPSYNAASDVALAQSQGNLGQVVSDLGLTLGAGALGLEGRSQKREADAYVSKSASELQLQGLEDLQKLRTDGDINTYTKRFTEAYDTRAQQYLDSAPNELAREAMQKHVNTLRTSLSYRALSYEAEEKTAQQRNSIEDAVNNVAIAGFSDPSGYSKYLGQMQQIVDSSGSLLPESKRHDLLQRGQSMLAASHVRGLLEQGPETAAAALNSDEVKAHITPAAYVSLSDAIDRAKEQRAREAERLATERVRAFSKDPYKLAIMNGADPNDYNDVLSKQYLETPDGFLKVPEIRKSVMSEDQAAIVVDQLSSARTSDEMLVGLTAIRDKYGDNSEIAFKDLKKAKLPDSLSYLLYMDPVTDRKAFKALFDVSRQDTKDLDEMVRQREMLLGEKSPEDTFSNMVTTELEPTRRALLAEGVQADVVSRLGANAEAIAKYSYVRGDSKKDAVAAGTSWLTSKYSVNTINDKPFRIPAGNDPAFVHDELTAGLSALKPDDLKLPEGLPEDVMAEHIKKTSGWVLDPYGSGYMLMDDLGAPVIRRDGHPVHLTFDQMRRNAAESKQRAKDVRKELMQALPFGG